MNKAIQTHFCQKQSHFRTATNVIPKNQAGHHIEGMIKPHKLTDLVSVGPATAADLEDLGITEIEHLIDKNAHDLFEQLQKIKGQRVDPCCEDVFRAAIEQARDPNLSAHKRQWPYWSKVRKGTIKE